MLAVILTSVIVILLLLGIIFVILFRLLTANSFKKCPSNESIHGKVVIVTGANSGIGYEAAKELAARGGKIILACRSEEKGIAAMKQIIEETGNNNVVYKKLDLSSLLSVRAFAKEIINTEKELHILMNNAGGFGFPNVHTDDGIGETMQVNYFGPFLLTLLLLPLLKKSQPSRIINVSSILHLLGRVDLNDIEKGKIHMEIPAYNNSKLYDLMFTVELSRKLKGTGVVTNAVHPGIVATNVTRNCGFITLMMFKFMYLIVGCTSPVGATTLIYLAVAKECANVSGKYFIDCRESVLVHPSARNEEACRKLWECSEKIVKYNLVEID